MSTEALREVWKKKAVFVTPFWIIIDNVHHIGSYSWMVGSRCFYDVFLPLYHKIFPVVSVYLRQCETLLHSVPPEVVQVNRVMVPYFLLMG